MKIQVRNGNVQSALRVFKKKHSDKLFEYRQREYYEKPSAIRRNKLKAAIVREKQRVRKNDRNKF